MPIETSKFGAKHGFTSRERLSAVDQGIETTGNETARERLLIRAAALPVQKSTLGERPRVPLRRTVRGEVEYTTTDSHIDAD